MTEADAQESGVQPNDDPQQIDLPDYEEDDELINAERKDRFTAYQARFREDEHAVELDWHLKSAQEQQAMDQALLAILSAEHREQEHRVKCENLRGRARNLMQARVKDFVELEICIRGLIPDYEAWAAAMKRLEECYSVLAQLGEDQSISTSRSSINYATRRALEFEVAHAAMCREITEMRAELYKLDREVPLDAQGRRRIPMNWDKKGGHPMTRLIHASREAAEQGQVGLVNARGATEWVPWLQLQDAEGAMSEGWLWLGFDEYGCVMDRVFRKDIFFEDHSWHDVRCFDGDMRDPNSKTPCELAVHNAMLAIPELNHVVRLREGNRRDLIDHEAMKCRIYVEWCQNGDLDSLIRELHETRADFPEPFIWFTAECLAECAVAMAGGTTADDPVDGWREIIHRDIKLKNLFLAEKDPTLYPHYPKPMLGDFGLAFRTTPTDPYNPRSYQGSGTHGFRPPEQCLYIDQQTQEAIKGPRMSQETNVYAIGLVLAAMVRLRSAPEQPIWLGEGEAQDALYSPEIPMDDPLYDYYSIELRQIINDCLSYDPKDRFRACDVREWIRQHTREPVDANDKQLDGTPWYDLAKGMRSGRADPGKRDHPKRLDIPLKGDKYQLRLAKNRLPGYREGE